MAENQVSKNEVPAGREQETKPPTTVTGAGETSVAVGRGEKFHDPDDGMIQGKPTDAAPEPNRKKKTDF